MYFALFFFLDQYTTFSLITTLQKVPITTTDSNMNNHDLKIKKKKKKKL